MAFFMPLLIESVLTISETIINSVIPGNIGKPGKRARQSKVKEIELGGWRIYE
jgi:hypothetical protein